MTKFNYYRCKRLDEKIKRLTSKRESCFIKRINAVKNREYRSYMHYCKKEIKLLNKSIKLAKKKLKLSRE